MIKEYITNSEKETEALGEQLAKTLEGGTTVAFLGSMGMGKTCFIRGIARGMGYTGEVTSPTFSLVNEYLGGRLNLYHFDMYRVSHWEDLYSTGFFDYLEQGGILLVEWSENVKAAIPNDALFINIERIDDTTRKITLCKGEF